MLFGTALGRAFGATRIFTIHSGSLRDKGPTNGYHLSLVILSILSILRILSVVVDDDDDDDRRQ